VKISTGNIGGTIGAMMPVAALWQLAQSWFEGRLSATWAPRSREASQQLLSAAGFVGPFWSLSGDA